MSDTEGYVAKRGRPRRRTTGGAESAGDIDNARKLGYGSDQEGHATLNRQQIIAMVKKRFGLRPDESGIRSHPTVPEEEVPPVPPAPASPSTPKQVKYENLLEKPGSYPTLPRKDQESTQFGFGSGPQGVIYLQYGDEIKRAMLPSDMSSVEHVRGLFERTFPDKFNDRNNNRKTIYIKDSSCGIFYELDDVKDMANKSHLKVLESKPIQNGPIRSHSFNSPSPAYKRIQKPSTPVINHSPAPVESYNKAYTTSTPLPNHSSVQPADEIHTGGGTIRFTKTTTTVTRMNNGDEKSDTTSAHKFARSQGSLMDKKKVALPGLGSKLKHHDHSYRSKDPVEDQLDSLTSMLQEALKTESMDSIPTNESSASSQFSTGSAEGNGYQAGYMSRMQSDSGTESMSSTDVCPTSPLPPATSKTAPPPPPRASSKNAAKEKYSQTLQRDTPSRVVKRDISHQYGTLPVKGTRTVKTIVEGREVHPRPLHRTVSAGSSTSGASTLSGSSSPVTVRYEGGTNVRDKAQLQAKATGLRQNLSTLRGQLGQLRQMQTYQAKTLDDMLKNAKDQIIQTVARLNPIDEPPVRSARKRVHIEEMSYHKTKNEVNRNISELESEVEMVRMDVIQKRGLANSSQVASLSSQLEMVSRQIADLRGNFTDLHDNMKSVMAGELEIIVQGEKFLKDEPSKLDTLVSRCKHVTGTLFTLQKLMTAQVQMHSESQVSFGSSEGEVDKEVLFDSIRSVQREYLAHKVGEHSQDPRNGENSPKARTRVRFNDEANTHFR